MNRKKRLKVLLGLNEIASNLQNLKKGFDAIGIHSDVVLVDDYVFGVDEKLIAKNWNISFARYAISLYRKNKHRFLMRHVYAYISLLARILLFIRCLCIYDVFIMMAYSRFFNYFELPILKFFKKKVIYQVVGSDFRPPYLNGSYLDEGLEGLYRLSLETKRRVEMIEKYATFVVSCSVVSHFQTKPFIDYRYFGAATDYSHINLSDIPEKYIKKQSIKIVHAPTNKRAKGTFEIIKVIEELKQSYDIEFVLLSGISNQEVLHHVASCDFVIDQIYSDGIHMPRFVSEAAYFKKPSIITGYSMPHLYEGIKDTKHIPPVLSGFPEELKDLVIKLIEDQTYKEELGQRAYEFVTQMWSVKNIAEQFVCLIDGDVPKEWWYYPQNNHQLWSYGKPKEKVASDLRAYILEFGVQALLMNHHPWMQEHILQQACLSDLYHATKDAFKEKKDSVDMS